MQHSARGAQTAPRGRWLTADSQFVQQFLLPPCKKKISRDTNSVRTGSAGCGYEHRVRSWQARKRLTRSCKPPCTELDLILSRSPLVLSSSHAPHVACQRQVCVCLGDCQSKSSLARVRCLLAYMCTAPCLECVWHSPCVPCSANLNCLTCLHLNT